VGSRVVKESEARVCERATPVGEEGAFLIGQRPTNFGAQQPRENILVRAGRRQTDKTDIVYPRTR